MTTQRFKCECSSHQISETTQHQFCLLCWLKLSQTCQDSRRDIDPQPSLERVLENFRVMFQNYFNVCLLTLGFHFSELILKKQFKMWTKLYAHIYNIINLYLIRISEGDQPWDFFGRTDAKAEAPVCWPPRAKS